MSKFADQLFIDLMREHRLALEAVQRPPAAARHAVPRPAWLAAGVVGMAGAVTAGVVALGGGSPAYAVTENPDGTVTVSLNQLSGVEGANSTLRHLGVPVVVAPVRAGCPTPQPATPAPGQHQKTSATAAVHDGSVTIDVHGVPAGDLALAAASAGPDGKITLSIELIKGPAPDCVSLPAPGPGASTDESGGSNAGPGPMVTSTQR